MQEERFTAQMYIQHYAEQRGITIAEIGVAPLVVLSWSPGVVQRLAERAGAALAENWPWVKRHPFYTGQVGERVVSFAQVGIGAPATVAGMEEMIACGAQTFIGLGWAGSLQPSAPIGSALIPISCVRDDGTTPHYCQDDRLLVPDPDLADRLYETAKEVGLPCQRGPHWTTDAPYRELLSTIEAHRAGGVLGVDMETAAMYALGVFRRVAVCNLLVVSDEVWHAWRSAAYTSTIREATLQAEGVVFEVLQGMA